MWSAFGMVLGQWAQDLQDLSDPLDVNKTFNQLTSAWDRLGTCVAQACALIQPMTESAAPTAGTGAVPKTVIELQELHRTLHSQRRMMEARLAVRGDLEAAMMLLIDPVPRSVSVFSPHCCVIWCRLGRE
jgi:hypothetical protein